MNIRVCTAAFVLLMPLTASAMYDPTLGRWLSRDPIGYRAGVNVYAYVSDDPVNRRDPLGLSDEIEKAVLDGGGGFGGPLGGSGGGYYNPEPLPTDTPGLETRGFRPPPGTRVVPNGIPDNWRVGPTDTPGGVQYDCPGNPHNYVRVMPGDPTSQYPNSQAPYARWQLNGQPLDVNGNPLSTAQSPDAHIPLGDYQFDPSLFPSQAPQ